MRIPPTASEAPHSLHLTSASQAGSDATLRVGGPAVGSSPEEHPVPGLAEPATGAQSYYAPAAGGARSYYGASPGTLDVYA